MLFEIATTNQAMILFATLRYTVWTPGVKCHTGNIPIVRFQTVQILRISMVMIGFGGFQISCIMGEIIVAEFAL